MWTMAGNVRVAVPCDGAVWRPDSWSKNTHSHDYRKRDEESATPHSQHRDQAAALLHPLTVACGAAPAQREVRRGGAPPRSQWASRLSHIHLICLCLLNQGVQERAPPLLLAPPSHLSTLYFHPGPNGLFCYEWQWIHSAFIMDLKEAFKVFIS
ncbi:hypothetical protein EYF80_002798 [Liparis tanakae]|uniref:Uncharacterized protein n=1 Tax=Liparis tanakae TaxID=230148 RepID=A0A4Z2JB99_9TELE|nr:hypothetical protein EYF80_002798 [Liparis tanakae]